MHPFVDFFKTLRDLFTSQPDTDLHQMAQEPFKLNRPKIVVRGVFEATTLNMTIAQTIENISVVTSPSTDESISRWDELSDCVVISVQLANIRAPKLQFLPHYIALLLVKHKRSGDLRWVRIERYMPEESRPFTRNLFTSSDVMSKLSMRSW